MTMFQHRHYVAIAKTIAELPDLAQKESAARILAAMLAQDNPRFNRERFLACCHGEPSNGRDK